MSVKRKTRVLGAISQIPQISVVGRAKGHHQGGCGACTQERVGISAPPGPTTQRTQAAPKSRVSIFRAVRTPFFLQPVSGNNGDERKEETKETNARELARNTKIWGSGYSGARYSDVFE